MAVYTLRFASWQDDSHLLSNVRKTVFIKEQQVPVELEWDEFDSKCFHVLACDTDGKPIGTARFLPDGHIGRMAVLKEWRGKGVGSAMLQWLLEEAKRRSIQQVVLNAQTSATGFYKKFGFLSEGKEFIDAGISHVRMVRKM